jgi:uncharacterized membrane protein
LTTCAWVEDGIPIVAVLLQVRWKLIRIVLGQLIANLIGLSKGVLKTGLVLVHIAVGMPLCRRRCWARNAWRAGIWHRRIL